MYCVVNNVVMRQVQTDLKQLYTCIQLMTAKNVKKSSNGCGILCSARDSSGIPASNV